jgi:hypothetical protein
LVHVRDDDLNRCVTGELNDLLQRRRTPSRPVKRHKDALDRAATAPPSAGTTTAGFSSKPRAWIPTEPDSAVIRSAP